MKSERGSPATVDLFTSLNKVYLGSTINHQIINNTAIIIDSHFKYLDTLTSKPSNATGINANTTANNRASLSHIDFKIIINKQTGKSHLLINFFILVLDWIPKLTKIFQ